MIMCLRMVGGETVGYLQVWVWTWDYQEQIQLVVRAELELGTSRLQIQHSNPSATLPQKLIIKKVNLVETGQKSSLKGIHVHSFM